MTRILIRYVEERPEDERTAAVMALGQSLDLGSYPAAVNESHKGYRR